MHVATKDREVGRSPRSPLALDAGYQCRIAERPVCGRLVERVFGVSKDVEQVKVDLLPSPARIAAVLKMQAYGADMTVPEQERLLRALSR